MIKRININEISSLNGSELLEFKLKTRKSVRGYLSATSTSHSSFFSHSNGVLNLIVIKSGRFNDAEEPQNGVFDCMIAHNEIKEVFIINPNEDNI